MIYPCVYNGELVGVLDASFPDYKTESLRITTDIVLDAHTIVKRYFGGLERELTYLALPDVATLERIQKECPYFYGKPDWKQTQPKEKAMRQITTHISNPVNDKIAIKVVDEPGHGNANHKYDITFIGPHGMEMGYLLEFQNGPINEVGVNGITHEVLLAVLIDRLEGFQRGPYNCIENEQALSHIRQAQGYLHSRTRKRMERGVEGTHKV